MGGYGHSSVVTVSGVATEDSVISMELSGLFGDTLLDAYVALENEAGDVRLEYHPLRFHLSLEQDGQMVPVKFCSGCENCSGHMHENPAESLTCSQCQNCYLRNMIELQEYLASEGNALNFSVAAGEAVDFRFEIGWEWEFAVEAPYSFEIRGENGTRYYFADGASWSQWYVSWMDSAIGSGHPNGNPTDIYDSDGTHWIIQDDIGNSLECYLCIGIQSVSDAEP